MGFRHSILFKDLLFEQKRFQRILLPAHPPNFAYDACEKEKYPKKR